MNSVPFFANTADDTHCVQASFRIMLKHFLPERDFSWAQLDKMSRKANGMGTWWFPVLLEIKKLGLETTYIESFDYRRYLKEGDSYVLEVFGPESGAWYLKNSNLNEVKNLIPDFLKEIKGEQRAASLTDVNRLLDESWLVALEINAAMLNNKDGLNPHMVVVFRHGEHKYWVHDPGLPPIPNRPISSQKLWAAWSFAGNNNQSLIAIKK